MRRLIVGVALVTLIVGAAALGFAAGGHATSKRPVRTIELHWGDQVGASAIKVGCGYTQGGFQGALQQRPNIYCFGPGTKGYDPELVVTLTRGAVQVDRCWNDCGKKLHLFTARR